MALVSTRSRCCAGRSIRVGSRRPTGSTTARRRLRVIGLRLCGREQRVPSILDGRDRPRSPNDVYRVAAVSGAGTATGGDRTFKTTGLADLGKAVLAGWKARVPVTCLAGTEGACSGTLRLISWARRISPLAAGSRAGVLVSLRRAVRARLEDKGRLAVKSTLEVHAGSLSATLTSTSTLRK
jgi:hypothetical protein